MPAVEYSNRKEHIRSIAQQLFRKYGYSATSMRQLAGEVGIEPASLYSHINSKEEILHSICFTMAEEFFNAQKALSQDLAPDLRLEETIIAHMGVVMEHLDASAVFFHDWRHLGDPSLKRFKQLRHEYENIFREILRDGMKQGVFHFEDENLTLYSLFSAMNWSYEWFRTGDKMNYKQIGHNLAQLFLKGLTNQNLRINK